MTSCRGSRARVASWNCSQPARARPARQRTSEPALGPGLCARGDRGPTESRPTTYLVHQLSSRTVASPARPHEPPLSWFLWSPLSCGLQLAPQGPPGLSRPGAWTKLSCQLGTAARITLASFLPGPPTLPPRAIASTSPGGSPRLQS